RRGLHDEPAPFPTRRSSDLTVGANVQAILGGDTRLEAGPAQQLDRDGVEDPAGAALDDARVDRLSGTVQVVADGDQFAVLPAPRSEEHTSELQSRENLVCRP